jgi:hypothetical protein
VRVRSPVPSIDSVQQKMYRAKTLYDELVRELLAYDGTNPGDLYEIPESTPANRNFVFKEKM